MIHTLLPPFGYLTPAGYLCSHQLDTYVMVMIDSIHTVSKIFIIFHTLLPPLGYHTVIDFNRLNNYIITLTLNCVHHSLIIVYTNILLNMLFC
jgi:hypothetical protein